MNDKLLNRTITLTERTDKTGKFGQMAKIKDEKGLTYTVYETKKDKTTSVAWKALQNIPLGTNVFIGYAEETVTHPQHGDYTASSTRGSEDIKQSQSYLPIAVGGYTRLYLAGVRFKLV